MSKIQFRESDSVQKVVGVRFSAGSSEFIRQTSHVRVLNNRLYEEGARNFTPAKCGPLDRRLGTSSNYCPCSTCDSSLSDCVGHFGYVDLAFPVFHIGFFKSTIQVLQCICKNCARLLLSESQRSYFLRQIANPTLNYIQRKALHKSIVASCKKTSLCLQCGQRNGILRKATGAVLKIAYSCGISECKMSEYSAVVGANPAISEVLSRSKFTLLNPLRVQKLFDIIANEDIPILMLSFGEVKHPKDLLLTRIPVPPACVRPSVPSEVGSGSTEDDLTMKLAEIILINDVLQKHKENGAPVKTVMETWDHLQIQVALYFNGELPGLPQELKLKKPIRGLNQRLKGKQGRFRGNLSGKRVDYSARTKLVISGSDSHPGANYVIDRLSGVKRLLKYSNRESCAKNLKVGDIVERHLDDNDIVLFNRQPSLHKVSIMCHRVRVMSGRTFRFNECVCTPYNADFDGDEMNLHVPQTHEARAEASTLMGLKSNLVTPRSGEPLVAAIQDFITGAFLMTHKDTFFDYNEACRLITSIIDHRTRNQTRLHLPTPAIVKPTILWTGKQLMRLIIADDFYKPLHLNLSVPNKSYTSSKELCSKDSFVIIRNGELMSGVLDKKLLGSGSKTNIFYVLLRDFGEDSAINALWRLSRMTSTFLSNRGFSIGVGDVQPRLRLLEEKSLLLRRGYKKCHDCIDQLKSGQLKAQPGCAKEETLEALILRELSSIRDKAGESCIINLSMYNSPLTMAICGSKGSFINISQMIACVGQQAIFGHRPPDGFDKRCLPHFEKSEKTPKAKGFVENSFFSGLTPTEFFFHSMAGREGLVDTAVKTAETGYMQRRLVKCLEDLCVSYDGTIRSSCGDIVEFVFGDDGLDPALMETNDCHALDLTHQLECIRNTIPFNNDEDLNRNDMEALYRALVDAELKNAPAGFLCPLETFVREIIEKIMSVNKISRFCRDHPNGKVQVQVHGASRSQFIAFLETCCRKLKKAAMEPGSAVGAIAATSIGEPSTQMTLKTFHFAGVASMNITQGVPRIKEIINAVKAISTPIITAKVFNNRDEKLARKVKARIDVTTLGEICDYIEEIIKPDTAFLLLKLSAKRIKLLNLEHCAEHRFFKKFSRIQDIAGLPNIKRCVVQADERHGDEFSIVAEGNDFRGILSQIGVDPHHTNINNAVVVAEVLGIEAARTCIINEILSTMEAHGIGLDRRHVMLLADVMTYRGEVLGITRNGLAKMKDSVLLLASFEKTMDHLYEAAFYSQKDSIRGVSECIILGVPISLGTGAFRLLQKVPTPDVTQREPIFMKPGFALKV
ncbi:unnamed protein product [Haemonchus placei]|uniref:DNA-directed RNA polymerase subunit n=1 Tax=Haemonchus placei TaxID=6290 RepID=A0A0N4WIV3_HAEPC|nr:unnamed protein product [Haemonchus placei]